MTELPVTLDEYEALLYRMAKEDPDGNGQADTYGLSNSSLNTVYGAYGFVRNAWLEDGNGGVVFGDVTPSAKDALARLAKWYADGVLDPEFITGENSGGYWAIPHAFVNRRIATSGIGAYYHWIDLPEYNLINQIPTAIDATENPFDVVFSQPPVGPNGACGTFRSSVLQYRTLFTAELVEDTKRFARLLEIIDDMTMDPDTSLILSRIENT